MAEKDAEVETTQRIKIRIGDAEFEAEGPVALVKEQFEAFMAVVKEHAIPRAKNIESSPDTGTIGAVGGLAVLASGVAGAPATLSEATPITDELLTRVYRRDGDGISLLGLPRTDQPSADALVALLYGYRRLLNRTAVNGYTLIRAAKQSGVVIPRVDTSLAKRTDFVLAAGAKRGRMYSLNNPGVVYAEELLRKIVG
jgi:hypothetical protein